MTESEKEKKIFLSYCGSRDQELLMGRKKMTLGDMERFSFLTEWLSIMLAAERSPYTRGR